jgi:hypothetical protein
MHSTILAVAVGSQLLTPVTDRIPKLDVEVSCKGSVEADKAMGLACPKVSITSMCNIEGKIDDM